MIVGSWHRLTSHSMEQTLGFKSQTTLELSQALVISVYYLYVSTSSWISPDWIILTVIDLDDQLPAVGGATFDLYENQHGEKCLPGTRTDLIAQIKEWTMSPQAQCIFWLNGMAGTGKSPSLELLPSSSKNRASWEQVSFSGGVRLIGVTLRSFSRRSQSS